MLFHLETKKDGKKPPRTDLTGASHRNTQICPSPLLRSAYGSRIVDPPISVVRGRCPVPISFFDMIPLLFSLFCAIIISTIKS